MDHRVQTGLNEVDPPRGRVVEVGSLRKARRLRELRSLGTGLLSLLKRIANGEPTRESCHQRRFETHNVTRKKSSLTFI